MFHLGVSEMSFNERAEFYQLLIKALWKNTNIVEISSLHELEHLNENNT